jgi:uncharacterized DUF497 family protein
MLYFEWDPDKSASNAIKHGISFDEAKTVFDDDFARLIPDPDHSEDEERFILLGVSCALKILTVVHCYRDSDETIRIISARRATTNEQRQYKEHLS